MLFAGMQRSVLPARSAATAVALGLAVGALLGAWPARPAFGSTSPVVGSSAQGRPIRAVATGAPAAPVRVLVVGCIHGSEGAGIPIARWLERQRPPAGVRLWVIEDLNPDGSVAGTRQNGRGVDLNRNFPWRWRPVERPGGLHYSGPRALSEPESRFAAALIRAERPVLTIWFHQALGLVDESGGNIDVERHFARLVGLPLVRLSRYPGSAASWQNALYPSTAMVVELPGGTLSPGQVARYGRAVLALAAQRR